MLRVLIGFIKFILFIIDTHIRVGHKQREAHDGEPLLKNIIIKFFMILVKPTKGKGIYSR